MRKLLMKLSAMCLQIIDATPTQGKTIGTELSIVISVVQYYYTLRRKTKNGTLTYKKSGKRLSFIVLFPLLFFLCLYVIHKFNGMMSFTCCHLVYN